MAIKTFTGMIRSIGEITSVTTQRGEILNRREVLLETNEKYPQSLLVELTNKRATEFCGIVGQSATAYLRFSTSASATGQVFNNIRCWRIAIND